MQQEQEDLQVSFLVDLLERQRALYRRLRTLAERQQALVVQEDTRPLLSLLAERQQLVDQLLQVSTRLSGFRQRWTEVYSTLDGPLRKRVSELLEESNATLGSILQNDARDTAVLSAKRQAMTERLAAVDAGARAQAAYRGTTVPGRRSLTDEQA